MQILLSEEFLHNLKFLADFLRSQLSGSDLLHNFENHC